MSVTLAPDAATSGAPAAALIAMFVVAFGLVGPPASPAQAAAADPTKNPHYFGPWPNWALSPLTTSKAQLAILGVGQGARAEAVIDPVTGGVTQVHILDAGSGYAAGTRVRISGGTTNAVLTPVVTTSGAVTGGTVTSPGGGYAAFSVTLSGGGGTGAQLRANGGVDAVHLADGGKGYTAPTVQFDLPDLDTGVQAKGHIPTQAKDGRDGMNADGTITEVVVDDPGYGYLTAPGVAIINGDQFNPVNMTPGGHLAQATTTLKLTGFDVPAYGSGYTAPPAVAITDPTGHGSGATATARTDVGAVTSIIVNAPGSGYLDVGIRKFVDDLPLFCDQAKGGCPAASGSRYLPIADPVVKSYLNTATGKQEEADQYEIGLVQYRRKFSADLPPTLVRGYVQLEPQNGPAPTGSQHVALTNELLDGSKVPVLVNGKQAYGVTSPQWLGPVLGASKNRPVRVVFRNLLPTGTAGDLFLPVDSTMMGSGMGPMAMADPVDGKSVTDAVRNPECSASPKPSSCFTDNRATVHLHGGITPWISDGTPHQWITPAGQSTQWPQGVSVQNVPDMAGEGCDGATDGCSTFCYTNQQSARLMFYHDHAWGETRLNIYAGEAAGYFITDDTEKALVANGTIPGPEATIPLFIQDRTFVPKDTQLYDQKATSGGTGGTASTIAKYGQDPTWNKQRWGGYGNLWYQHVYMPAQNPGDPSGASAYGRWFYGPWF